MGYLKPSKNKKVKLNAKMTRENKCIFSNVFQMFNVLD